MSNQFITYLNTFITEHQCLVDEDGSIAQIPETLTSIQQIADHIAHDYDLTSVNNFIKLVVIANLNGLLSQFKQSSISYTVSGEREYHDDNGLFTLVRSSYSAKQTLTTEEKNVLASTLLTNGIYQVSVDMYSTCTITFAFSEYSSVYHLDYTSFTSLLECIERSL